MRFWYPYLVIIGQFPPYVNHLMANHCSEKISFLTIYRSKILDWFDMETFLRTFLTRISINFCMGWTSTLENEVVVMNWCCLLSLLFFSANYVICRYSLKKLFISFSCAKDHNTKIVVVNCIWIQQKFYKYQAVEIDSANCAICFVIIEIFVRDNQSIKIKKLRAKQRNRTKGWEISKKCGGCLKCEILHEIEMIQNDCHFSHHHRQHRVIDRQALAALIRILVLVQQQRDHYSAAMVAFYPVLIYVIHFGARVRHR